MKLLLQMLLLGQRSKELAQLILRLMVLYLYCFLRHAKLLEPTTADNLLEIHNVKRRLYSLILKTHAGNDRAHNHCT